VRTLAPLKDNPKVLVLVSDAKQAPGLIVPSTGETVASMFGLLGAGLYAAATYKSQEKQVPLLKKMADCGLPAYFDEQLRHDAALNAGWVVETSSAMKETDRQLIRRVLFKSGNAMEKSEAAKILQPYDQVVLSEIVFYGIRSSFDNQLRYEVEARFSRINPQDLSRALWKGKNSSRHLQKATSVDIKTEPGKEQSDICRQLFQEGRALSRWMAMQLGVPESSLNTPPLVPATGPNDQELKI